MSDQEKNAFYAPGKDWIQTNSGRKFWPLNPHEEDIILSDIAHALAMQVRFTGHLNRFYSVAEHSVHVAEAVEILGGNETAIKQALLHDASEAYLCDIASPVKRSPEFTSYRGAEEKLQKTIYRKYGLPEDMLPIVKEADLIMLKVEAQEMFSSWQPEWKVHLSSIKIPEGFKPHLGFEWHVARQHMKDDLNQYWGTKC